MKNTTFTRFLAFSIAAASISFAAVSTAHAGNSTSLGHGVKCTWVLVSSVGASNTYKQVCRKGV